MRKTSGGLTEISLSKKLGRNCADLVEGVRDVFIRVVRDARDLTFPLMFD